MSSVISGSTIKTLQIDAKNSFEISQDGCYQLAGTNNKKIDIYITKDKNVEIVDLSIDCSIHLHLDSGVNLKMISLKYKVSNTIYEVFINGAGVDFNLDSISIAQADDNIGIYSTVHHTMPNSQSYQYIKCIGTDSSTTTFEGKVHILKGAGGTNAYQQNKNLMLSDEATILARPWLEVYADDVKCSHGSTTGMLSEDEIFYMRQRGIPLKSAQKLQIEGFILGVTQKISNESLREKISKIIFKIIEKL